MALPARRGRLPPEGRADLGASSRAWFAEQGFPIAPRYFERYEDQVEALLDGALDTAWNTNLAHVQVAGAHRGAARALAMRDTDRGWRSLIVARAGSALRTLEDLRGRRVGFGDADSPQAHILPVHALRAAGFDPVRDCVADAAGPRPRQARRHRRRRAGAARARARRRARRVRGLERHARRRRAARATLRTVTVWESPPFHHCCFTVSSEDPRHGASPSCCSRWTPRIPKLCEPMELEYVNRWVPFDPDGYARPDRRRRAPGRSSSARSRTMPRHDAAGRGLAAFRIFFGLVLFSNGLAKLFEFRTIEIGPYSSVSDQPSRGARDPRLRGQPARRRRHRRAGAAGSRQRRVPAELGRLPVARRPRSSSAPARR